MAVKGSTAPSSGRGNTKELNNNEDILDTPMHDEAASAISIGTGTEMDMAGVPVKVSFLAVVAIDSCRCYLAEITIIVHVTEPHCQIQISHSHLVANGLPP